MCPGDKPGEIVPQLVTVVSRVAEPARVAFVQMVRQLVKRKVPSSKVITTALLPPPKLQRLLRSTAALGALEVMVISPLTVVKAPALIVSVLAFPVIFTSPE